MSSEVSEKIISDKLNQVDFKLDEHNNKVIECLTKITHLIEQQAKTEKACDNIEKEFNEYKLEQASKDAERDKSIALSNQDRENQHKLFKEFQKDLKTFGMLISFFITAGFGLIQFALKVYETFGNK